ncbi:MAG: YciI family protein [Burkholderiaceae bacterium]|nr:YciI family protein [Burkholderiaceae bacterium]
MHFLLIYDLADDYLQRRPDFRAAHLELAWRAKEQYGLILAGPLSEPADTAVLFFDCEDSAPIEAFAKADPYVKHGLVKSWRVRRWDTVVGDDATTPTRVA